MTHTDTDSDDLYRCAASLARKYLAPYRRLGRRRYLRAFEEAQYQLNSRLPHASANPQPLLDWLEQNLVPLASPEELAIMRVEMAGDPLDLKGALNLALSEACP